jgi:hypothetical protein
MNPRHRWSWPGWALALVLLAAAPARAEEIVRVSGRPGITQAYLLLYDKQSKPKVAAVLFPGGDGLMNLHQQGDKIELDYKGNFLVRTRTLLRDPEVAVAAVDAPSDLLRRGYSDQFRQSKDHADDVAAVVKDLRERFAGAKIFLVGTSRGTVSAAYAGRALGKSIDGVILTSTVSKASLSGTGVSGFNYGDLQVPLLIVHHVQDSCNVSPYSGVEGLAGSYTLISVRGGKRPESDACEARSAHGYFGKEEETIAAMKAWMLGRPFPKTIE